MSEIETRNAQVVDVSYPKRIVELIVMPYEKEAQVAYQGRMVTEVCSRGAYDGVQVRTSQIKVNRDHNMADPVGQARALHPSRQEGLVAEVYISKAREDVLTMAGEGLYGASAGFMLLRSGNGNGPVVPNAEVWETRSRRRLNHLRLHHIAMTSDPAYDAPVLDVRQAAVVAAATPNRDRLEIEELVRRRNVIDLRYGLKR